MDRTVVPSRVLERFTWFEPDESEEGDAEVEVLLKKIDGDWRRMLESSGQRKEDLMEIFLQLGRRPKAIFDNGRSREAVFLTSSTVCERAHIDRFIDCLGWQGRLKSSRVKSLCFPTTLHRVSLITKGVDTDFSIIGINIRIGRSMTGVMRQMCPWVLSPRSLGAFQGEPPISLADKSVLFIGRPGSGKTTLIREMARLLSRPSAQRDLVKTVIVVDKINEIAGDFEVPHICIGEARWMPCGSPEMLPQIMREAVESNNPDVVLVDELSTLAEVDSACDIAKRGVSLIATVHGNTLVDTLNCPVRQALLGGAPSDPCGTFRQPRCAPAFDVAIELHQKDRWILHPNVRYAVDNYLRGDAVEAVELRPGLAVAILGIPVEDGLSYCCACSPTRRCASHKLFRSPSPMKMSGTLGRLPCSATLLEEEKPWVAVSSPTGTNRTADTLLAASYALRSPSALIENDVHTQRLSTTGRPESRSPRVSSKNLPNYLSPRSPNKDRSSQKKRVVA